MRGPCSAANLSAPGLSPALPEPHHLPQVYSCALLGLAGCPHASDDDLCTNPSILQPNPELGISTKSSQSKEAPRLSPAHTSGGDLLPMRPRAPRAFPGLPRGHRPAPSPRQTLHDWQGPHHLDTLWAPGEGLSEAKRQPPHLPGQEETAPSDRTGWSRLPPQASLSLISKPPRESLICPAAGGLWTVLTADRVQPPGPAWPWTRVASGGEASTATHHPRCSGEKARWTPAGVHPLCPLPVLPPG